MIGGQAETLNARFEFLYSLLIRRHCLTLWRDALPLQLKLLQPVAQQ